MLHQVIREQKRRNKRPVDEEILHQKELLLDELLAEKDEEKFLDAIRALGLQEDSDEWNAALEAWQAHRREVDRGRTWRF
jgi:hypothetical protein